MSRLAQLVASLLLALSGCVSLGAQAFDMEDEGPYQVYYLDSYVPSGAVSQNTPAIFASIPISGFVGYRLYWPGAPNPLVQTPFLLPGPYRPLVMFMHGWAASPLEYHALLVHLASWGFVVAAPYYNVNPVANQLPIEEAYEAWVLHEYLLAEAAAPGSPNPVNGMVDPDPGARYAIAGHSMGATACFYLAGADSRVDNIVSLEPFEETEIQPFGSCNPTALFGATAAALPLAENYQGAVYLLEGNDDLLVNGSVDTWFQVFNQGSSTPRRNVKLSIDGMGHFGATDAAITGSSMPALPCNVAYTDDMGLLDQHRLHRRFLATCLLAEHDPATNEGRFLDLFGDGMRDETVYSNGIGGPASLSFSVEGNCRDTIIWAEERNFPWDGSCGYLGAPIRPNSVSYGILGQPGDEDVLALLVPTVLFGGACPTGVGYLNYCIFELYNFIGFPSLSIGGSGLRECNLPILGGGVQVLMVAYVYRGGPFDLTRFATLVTAP
ncbi:MAG: hypothetical protein H6807_02840 [Planctomycetes bacterium]|nr:hypothetical protein [Planctomycetota bacterium]